MGKLKLTALASSLLGLLLVAACDKKSDGPGHAPAASTTAAAVHSATPSAHAPMTASAPASAAPSGSASTEAGAVHMHIDSVKVASGKVEGAERKLKTRAAVLRKKCLDPALKKEPAIDGTVKMAFDLSADGKVTKMTPTPTGKVPDDLVTCLKATIEKDIEFDTDNAKAKLEVTISFGPNVKPAK